MKFVREISNEGIKIPQVAVQIAKMEVGSNTDLCVSEGTMILLKRKMTAMDLIKTSQYLHEVASELIVHLATACGTCGDCEECGPCDDCEEHCSFNELDDKSISLPDHLRDEAGFPEGAKLCAFPDKRNGVVIISAVEYEHDLSDVPELVIEMLANSGTAICALEEHLMKGDVIYDRT